MRNKRIISIVFMLVILCMSGLTVSAAKTADVEEEQEQRTDVVDEETIIHSIVDGKDYNEKTTYSENVYKKTIHVAWYEKPGYFEKDMEGNLYGFGMDYLNAIAEYTGWQYEFMQGTREQCIDYLEAGLADIMSPVGVETEFENAQVAREVIGEDYGYIYKAANNYYLNFEDKEDFAKVTLGIEKKSGLLENLKRYCEEKGIVFYDVIAYESLDDLRLALSNGKIDAFVTDSYAKLDNMKVIGEFSNNRVTFAASKEYVLEQLNYALEHIKLENPNFSTELKEKYFGEGSQKKLEYTVEEKEFLKVHHNYKVVLSLDQYPLSYLGNEGKEYRGITQDVLAKIENQTEIKFDIIYVDSYAKAEEILQKKEADILGGIVLNSQNIETLSPSMAVREEKNQEHMRYTDAFYNIALAFVGMQNTNVEDAATVAIPAYMERGLEMLQENYAVYNFVVYESDNDCFEAVLSKEVDLAIQPDLKINEITMYEKYKSLQNLKYVPGNYVASFWVNTEDELLLSILNKAIRSISEASISSIENNNMQHVAMHSMSVKDFLVIYKWYIIAGCIGVVVFIASISLYLKYKREAADKEKAYRDRIANVSSMVKFRIDAEPILKSEFKTKYYLIVADIDKFKVINTLYGYGKGDETIAFVAKILKDGLKNGDYITRSTADKFNILKRAENDEEVSAYLENVFAKINERLNIEKTNYRMMLKVGIYQISPEDDNISSIIDKASMAKKQIRKMHQSTYVFYDDKMRQAAIEEKRLENEMDAALEERQFEVYLQPQIDLDSKKIVSAEALVRWKHPERGIIAPVKFIPVFEKNGFISKLDYFVWEEVVKILTRWKQEGRCMVPIAINLSRTDMEQDDVVENLIGLMERYQLDTKWVKLELTESIYSDEEAVILERMQQLREYGFKIAVDDFGSGYSSLHLLKKMPIDILKIDKSFLDIDIDMNIRDEIVIRDVVSMGKHLELQIIVEGVETLIQSDFLEMIGVDIVQGYYYGRPMPVGGFEDALFHDREGGR